VFIRPCHRTKDGKRHAYWALVESYRTERGPRQRTVAYLGKLDEQLRQGVKRAAQGNASQRQTDLFEPARSKWFLLRKGSGGSFQDSLGPMFLRKGTRTSILAVCKPRLFRVNSRRY